MKWRPKWSTVTIALAVIAALAIASPVLGLSKSIKKAIKKEVSKQVANATGPAGANGTNGTNGANGADGTARAYAKVSRVCTGAPPEICPVDHAKGVTGVTRVDTGKYCVDAPGIDSSSVPAAVTVEWGDTMDPEGNGSAMTRASALDCTGGDFEVVTDRHVAAAPADFANDVGFTIVIP